MRIRTVKPAFWRSLTITALPLEIRLFFIGLWNYVDDEGRGLMEPRLIKGDLFPLDDTITPDVLMTWLRALDDASLIVRYTDDRGRPVLAVRSFGEHQRVDRPKPSEIPEPPEVSTFVESSATNQRSIDEPSTLEGNREGNREQGKEGKVSRDKRGGRTTWLTPFGEAWETQYGGQPAYGQLGKALKPLVDTHGDAIVLRHWRHYLAQTEAEYASPSRFAQTFGRWDPAAEPAAMGHDDQEFFRAAR